MDTNCCHQLWVDRQTYLSTPIFFYCTRLNFKMITAAGDWLQFKNWVLHIVLLCHNFCFESEEQWLQNKRIDKRECVEIVFIFVCMLQKWHADKANNAEAIATRAAMRLTCLRLFYNIFANSGLGKLWCLAQRWSFVRQFNCYYQWYAVHWQY